MIRSLSHRPDNRVPVDNGKVLGVLNAAVGGKVRKAAFSLVLFLLYSYFVILFSPWLVARLVANYLGSRVGWLALDWEARGQIHNA